MVGRLKPILDICANEKQAIFIPHRQMLDNVIITHEFFHCFGNKRNNKKGYMTLKQDMSKAYDKVEWNFLRVVIERMSFCDIWINYIMQYVSSISYALLNGKKVDFVRLQRGLKQGDPFSPYLFLLCTEDFNNLIQKATKCGRLSSVWISRGGSALFTCFFVDDSLIFYRANV